MGLSEPVIFLICRGKRKSWRVELGERRLLPAVPFPIAFLPLLLPVGIKIEVDKGFPPPFVVFGSGGDLRVGVFVLFWCWGWFLVDEVHFHDFVVFRFDETRQIYDNLWFCLLLRFTWRRFGYNRKACRPASGGALFSYSCDSVGVGLKQTLQTFDLILGFGEFSMYVAVDTTQLT